ncbi:MAG: histidine phosphatase family protein [Cyanobacteria bacterium J06638_20]
MRLSPNITRLILVRHGRSTFNDQQRYQGSSDEAVLNDRGWLQAKQIGQWLPLSSLDAIYVSPLRRAQQTVEGIFAEQQSPSALAELTAPVAIGARQRNSATLTALRRLYETPVTSQPSLDRLLHTSPLLREIDLPEWQGLPYAEVKQRYANDYRCWKKQPHIFQQGNISPVSDLYGRSQAFLRTVVPKHVGQTVLVVSHGGTNHALISTALGLPPQTHHCLQQSNGGISILDYDHLQQRFTLQSLNATQHLGESLPKLKEGKRGVRLLLVPVEEGADDGKTIAPLASLGLGFCLAQNHPLIQTATQPLLQEEPALLQTRMLPTDWLAACHTVLTQHQNVDNLLTGVAIASPRLIQQLIARAIAPSQSPALDLKPGTLSVIHSPTDHRPILQAMNINLATCPSAA